VRLRRGNPPATPPRLERAASPAAPPEPPGHGRRAGAALLGAELDVVPVRWMLHERALRAAGLLDPDTTSERPSLGSPVPARLDVTRPAGGPGRHVPSWPGPWHLEVPLRVLTAGMDRAALIHLIATAQAGEPVNDPTLRAWLRAQCLPPASADPARASAEEDTRRRAGAVEQALTMSSSAWGRVVVDPAALWLAVCRHRYGLMVDVFTVRWDSTLLTSWRHPMTALARAGWSVRPGTAAAVGTANLAAGLQDLPSSVQAHWSGRSRDGAVSPWPPPPQRAGSSAQAAQLTPRQARGQAAALLHQVIADAALLRRQAAAVSAARSTTAPAVSRRHPTSTHGADVAPLVGEYVFPSAAHPALMDVTRAVAYQDAEIAAAEAWEVHGDPARRPSLQSLHLLAALQHEPSHDERQR